MDVLNMNKGRWRILYSNKPLLRHRKHLIMIVNILKKNVERN